MDPLQLLRREMQLLTLLFLILHSTVGFYCYKKCSCSRKLYSSRKYSSYNKNLKYLDIRIDKSGIEINCRNVPQMFVPNVVSFDANYLTSIDDSSSLTMEEMIRRCQKTMYRHIKYSLNTDKLRRIMLSNRLLTIYPNITYLNIENNILYPINKKNILNMEKNFFWNIKKMKALSLTNFNIKMKDFKQLTETLEHIDLSSNNLLEIDDGIFNTTRELKVVKLNNNKILNLDRSQITNLRNITYFDLSQNRINIISKRTFIDFSNLRYLNISFNNLYEIQHEGFLKMNHLETLDLSNNENLTLQGHIFKGLSELKYLNISQCNLNKLPSDLFQDTVNLQHLNISRNILTSIENKTFGNLRFMNTLDLSFNKLQFLPNEIFINTTSIREIYINNNKFMKLSLQLFSSATFLKIIDAGSNAIEQIGESNVRIRGNEFILRNNRIKAFSELLYINVMMSILDLSNNYIQEVVLNRTIIADDANMSISLVDNQIKNMDIKGISRGHNWSIYLDTENNYIQCNCKSFDVGVVDDKSSSKSSFIISATDTICINQEEICDIFNILNCPIQCNCSYVSSDMSIIVDCSSRNLTKYPVLSDIQIDNLRYTFNKIVVLLNDNHLDLDMQENLGSYHNVSVLDLSNNKITDLKWTPPDVIELNLMDNELKTLNEKVIVGLGLNKNLRKIHLGNNNWICDENAKHLQSFLIEFNNIKVNKSEVVCNKTGEYLIYTNIFPQQNNVTKMVLLVTATVFLALLSALMMVYYWYGDAIKIYLYSKNICLWCIAEEELDKEKEFDIFISYSHKDESFVQNELLKELESGDIPFKICIHYRNWLPGEFISKQIIDSVLNSRRTLVILSNNFMESVWGKMEFRTAHTQAISEGRARVIVVLYGDLNEDTLDEEMKNYLKTNTYVKWGDPWFWNKLKYALPHSKSRPYSKTNEIKS
ncbi:uncharacterized protein LOC143206958 isoform X2 [Rhynchophorus ferrugineus]